MADKKYTNLSTLRHFLTNLKNIFADKETALYKTPQKLTLDEVNQVRENIHSVGQHTAGLTYYPFNVIGFILFNFKIKIFNSSKERRIFDIWQ
ncbi:MAG: hypothetical protein J6R59_09770 [Paludibacteraceae bacterium]|nr:hypothetical protein [Paludibacteraceae bacterium]